MRILPIALSFAALQMICVSSVLADENTQPSTGEKTKPITFDEFKKSVDMVDISKHTMKLEDFRKAVPKPDTVILDLRDKKSFDDGHIKGAKHLGADITADRLAELVPNKKSTVVVYCTNTLFPSRMIALTHVSLPQIIKLGYPNSFQLEPVWQRNTSHLESFTDDPLWEKGKAASTP